METIQKLKKGSMEAAKYAGRQLLGGAWGDLGARYGAAVGGLEPHVPTLFPPAPLVPFPNGPNGSNLHVRLRDPVESGWELVEPREEAA